MPFIPFREVLPRVAVFVTNGGFGAVNQALSMGVPIVIAGETEDNTCRCPRSVDGRRHQSANLGPTPEVRNPVREGLRDDSYRSNAA
jgi:UDP:flavonoid glycosyltransferase YjiC (YdhE family)